MQTSPSAGTADASRSPPDLRAADHVDTAADDQAHDQTEPQGDTDRRAWRDFRVEHPRERFELLEQLRQTNAPVLISCPDGTSFSTTLWGVDETLQRVNFHVRDDSHQLDTLVESDEAMAVAYLERIKLQFDLHDLLLVHGASARALQCRVPGQIYRFQRRQAFRVTAAQRHTPGARMRHPALPDMQLDLRVVDVSLGGCALWLPNDVPPLQMGSVLADVQIQLDLQTQMVVELTLRHVSSMGCTDGPERGVRLGCSWRPVNPAALRSLQRWIDQAQKRMRLLNAS